MKRAAELTGVYKAAAASGNRSFAAGYGENCHPDDFDALDKVQTDVCGDNNTRAGASTANRLGKCTEGMFISELWLRQEAFQRCADARDNLAKKCFNGGDENHRQARDGMSNAAANCNKHMELLRRGK